MCIRIIAKLDSKPPNIVKPICFEGLKIVGTPTELANKYYNQGIDEIFYIDIVSSLYQREILYEQIRETGADLFVPFAVGGGIKNINDCSNLFHSGADKIVINTFAIQHDPSIINRAAEIFGSQSVVVNIEAKQISNEWFCYTDSGKIISRTNVLSWVEEIQKRGAGEILLQSVDKDGLKSGFDINLAKEVISKSSIPVVVASGAGNLDHIGELLSNVSPSGIALASILHFDKVNIKTIKDYISSF